MRRYLLACLSAVCVIGACRKPPPSPAATEAQVAAASADELVRDQAMKDLQDDLVTLRLQLGVVSAIANAAATAQAHPRSARGAIYTCDRVAVAQRQLAGVPRAQAALGEAESLCAYQAPLAAAGERLDAPAIAPADCAATRELLERLGAKYRDDAAASALIARFKRTCPHARLFAHAHASSGAPSAATTRGPDPEACRRRCEDNAWSCSSSCQYCGSCTNDKTWDWCNATCNNCKQGCTQAKNACDASCGGF